MKYTVFMSVLIAGCVMLTDLINGGLGTPNFPVSKSIAKDMPSTAVHLGTLPMQGETVRDEDAQWIPMTELQQSGRAQTYEGEYWIRLRPTEQTILDPYLWIRGIESYEVYGKGERLFRFNIEPFNPKVRTNNQLRLVPLSSAGDGFVYIRVILTEPGIPLYESSYLIVKAEDALSHALRQNAVRAILGIIFSFLGAASIFAFASNRKQTIYLFFALLNIGQGLSCFVNTSLLSYYVDASALAYFSPLFMPFSMVAYLAFLERMYGKGRRSVNRLLLYFMAAYFACSAAAAWFHEPAYEWLTGKTFQWLLFTVLIVLSISIIRSHRLQVDGKMEWIMLGNSVMILLWIYKWLMFLYPAIGYWLYMNWPLYSFYWQTDTVYIAGFIFVLCTGLALSGYLRNMHEKVHIYAGQLEEQNTRLKELDELKDEFLANTSHEIRTPLQGIIGISESLLEGVAGPLTPAVRSNLQLIADSGSRLTGLVNDILDLSRLRHGDLQLRRSPVHMRQAASVVMAVFVPLARQKNILLINDIDQHIPLVDADENRLQQILYNVIGNAYKFTDRGEVRIRAVEEDGFLAVEVRDTGIGIDRADQEAVLEPFVQAGAYRPNGGTGLGLPITRKLVELHGGQLKLSSVPGAGTKVSFTLPIVAEAAVPGDQAAIGDRNVEASLRKYETPAAALEDLSVQTAASRTDGAEATILVVDDEPINLQVWIHYLAETGHRIMSAGSGAEALRIVQERKPDLVLLDIMMPGMTGYEVCAALRKQYHPGELPIVLLTAKNQPSDILQGFDAGANDFLIKPISKRELLARLQMHLELAQLNQALEEQVRERTADLENTYRQLQDSMMETYEALGEVAIWEERNRIAHEIHDILGHKLTGAAMQLEAAKRLMLIDPDSAQSKLDAALESVRKGLEDVRVAVRMMKENSPKDDLAESLNELMDETEHMAGITIRRSISDDIPSLDALMKKTVYHALQEGLTNGIKHGGSKCFEFVLRMDGDTLRFALHNDGAPYTAVPYGFGLSTMKEKIRHLGGSIELSVSDILGGSVLRIEIPLKDC